MINHHNAARLATTRENPVGNRPTSPRSRAVTERLRTLDTTAFNEGIRSVARRLLFSTPLEHHKFLSELAREEERVQMKQLQRLLGIAATSSRPEDREAVVDLVRMHCDVQRELLGVEVAGDLETEAQGSADCAARAFERTRTRAAKERALETLRRHFAALRALIDSIEAHPVQ